MKKLLIVLVLVTIGFTQCKKSEEVPDGLAVKVSYFTAYPDTVAPGEFSKLSWLVFNAATVSIDNGIGQVQSVGEITVSPKATTVYILTASKDADIKTASAKITVKEIPPSGHAEIKLFEASDYDVPVYKTVQVEWDVVNSVMVKYCGGVVQPIGSSSKEYSKTTTVTLDAAGTDNQWVRKSFEIKVDTRSACNWFTSGSYGWTYPNKYTCRITTSKNGSPYYSAENLTFRVILFDASNAVIDGGTGTIPSIKPGEARTIDVNLPNGMGGLADHVSVTVSKCNCDFSRPD